MKDPPESDGGLACFGDSIETNFCNTQGCPRDCQWGPWSKWTECSRHCGGGKIKRFRDIAVSRQNGGERCVGLFEQEADCNVAECPVICVWGDWSEWSTCPVSCNGGLRLRNRGVKQQEEHGGTPCEGNKTEKASCGTAPCPVDCYFEPWSDWFACSASCNGDRYRTRVKVKEMFDGKPCEGEMLERGPCDSQGAQGCPTTTTTTTIGFGGFGTITTKKPIKPCNRSNSSNQTAQISSVIKSIQTDQTSSSTKRSESDQTSSSMKVSKNFSAAKSADAVLPNAAKSNVIAEVAGDLSLDVADADRFLSNFNATQAMTQVIADIAQVLPEVVKIHMSLVKGSLLDTWRRRAAGNVNVAYMIDLTADSDRKSADLTSSISQQEISQVNTQVQQSLNSHGVSISVRVASLSVTVLPMGHYEEGSGDAASLMDQEKSRRKGAESLKNAQTGKEEGSRTRADALSEHSQEESFKEGERENQQQHEQPIKDADGKPSGHRPLVETSKHLAETEEESIKVELRAGKEREEKLANEVERLLQTLKAQNEASAIKVHDQKNAGLVESAGRAIDPNPITKSAASFVSCSILAVAAATVAFMS